MKKLLPITTILTFLFLSLAASPSLAVDSQPLTVAPARQQLDMTPGETSTIIIKLLNHSDNPVSGTLKAVDFIVTDDQGTPQFLEDQNFSSDYSAANWIKLPYNRLTLPANDKVELQIQVQASTTAFPGGHYAAVIFEANPNGFSPNPSLTQNQQTIVAPRIASLIYVTIPGDYQESALITKFHTPKFSQHGPITIDTTIKNLSPTHIRPSGTITITNMFGDTLAYLPLEELNIFPNTERAFQNTFPTKWLIGRYQANIQATYGTQGKTLQATIFFTVFPTILLAYFLIIILAIIFIIKTLKKRNQKYQQHLEREVIELKKEISQLENK